MREKERDNRKQRRSPRSLDHSRVKLSERSTLDLQSENYSATKGKKGLLAENKAREREREAGREELVSYSVETDKNAEGNSGTHSAEFPQIPRSSLLFLPAVTTTELH